MPIVLWAVMVTLGVLAWFMHKSDRPLVLRVGFALIHVVFLVWVILTRYELVGFPWLIVAVLLAVAVTFRADIERACARAVRPDSGNE